MFIGHKYHYERGVLHRDISPGNILIKWQPGSKADEPSGSGCLIDLDHAKKEEPSSVSTQSVDVALDDVILVWCSMNKVDKEAARQALTFFVMESKSTIPVLMYLEAVLGHASKFRPFTEQVCTPQHLRW